MPLASAVAGVLHIWRSEGIADLAMAARRSHALASGAAVQALIIRACIQEISSGLLCPPGCFLLRYACIAQV